ncbi:MAG TPA: hypothetical protein PLY73_08005, partial [Candidatus Ozemobacteraceae bacterium]|nr:hypothetical protein [Candidatus Ozemobacteraceae bacterium]
MTPFRGKTLGIALGLMLCVACPGWPAGRTGRGQTIVPAESRMSDQEAAFLLGKLLSEDSSRETEAVNWLEKTLLLTPENREARFLLAQTLVRLKRFSAAIPHLEDLLSKAGNGLPGHGPEIESVRTELAGALLAAGDAARARDLLQAPPETALPPSPRRWEILGDSSMSLADFAGAIAAYRTGLGWCASGTASQNDLSQMASRFERKLALAFLYRGDVRQAEPALSAFHRKHP